MSRAELEEDSLFPREGKLRELFAQREKEVADKIDNLSDSDFEEYEHKKKGLVDALVEEYGFQALRLDTDKKKRTTKEGKLDVSIEFGRVPRNSNEPVFKNSFIVSWHIPIEGDLELFNYNPGGVLSTAYYTQKGCVDEEAKELILAENFPVDHPEETIKEESRKDFEERIGPILKTIAKINEEVKEYNVGLKVAIAGGVQKRKQELDKLRRLKND